MNILYISYKGRSKDTKMPFVRVLECWSGFFKIFFKKNRTFSPRVRMCAYMI